MDETTSSLFGSLFCPDWRESEAQLTEKQAVLLMHDIYLAHHVSREGIRPSQENVCTIEEFPMPETFTQVHTF